MSSFFQHSLRRTLTNLTRNTTQSSSSSCFVPASITSRLFSSNTSKLDSAKRADEFRLGYHKTLQEDVLEGKAKIPKGNAFEWELPGEGNYLLSAYCTPNNFIIGLTLVKKEVWVETGRSMTQHYVIITETTGQCGFKKGQRGTMEAATQTSLKMMRHLRSVINGEYPRTNMTGKKWPAPTKKPKAIVNLPPLQTLQVRWRGFGNGREALYKVLMSDEAKEIRDYIINVGDRTPVPIGGPKPRKERKV